MELQPLEMQLSDLAGQCEQLVALLVEERQAMKAWQVDGLAALAEEKEARLEAMKASDEALRDRVEALSYQYGCSKDQIFSHAGSGRLRALRAQVEAANATIRRESELNRQIAEHAVAFLARVRGEAPAARPLTYSRAGLAHAGSLMHHIL